MANVRQKRMSTETLVLGAIMTALVIVFQILATYTTFFGPFSTAIALVPIIIGAAMCSVGIGGWLGFVFGFVVIATGGAALFWAFDIPGTIITVLVKGTACGLASATVYKLLNRFNQYVAVIASSLTCPIVNTAVFLLGCAVFFLDDANKIAEAVGMNISGMALFYAFAMGNFLFELGMCLVLSPIIVRLLKIKIKTK